MFDAEELKEEGLDMAKYAEALERAMMGLRGIKPLTKEAEHLGNMLDSAYDQCLIHGGI